MTKVKLSDLSEALQFVSSDYSAEAYLCRETGNLYWTGDEADYAFDEIQLPDDLDDVEKYIPVPDKRDLDLGTQLVFDFIDHHLPKYHDEIRAIFRRKGVYGRFKGLLYQQHRIEQWYEFSDAAEKRALLEWCKEHGLEANGEEASCGEIING